MARILVIDDEPKILKLIGRALQDAGHRDVLCSSGAEALRHLETGVFDLMVSDVRLPDISGHDLLLMARDIDPNLQVILITAYGTIAQAVEAIRNGACDYILKPFEIDGLISIVEKNLATSRLREDLRILKSEILDEKTGRGITGKSPQIQQVKNLIRAVAATPTSVLITGDSGTGKELVAETIHELGAGNERPLVRVNCLAIPHELMESHLFGHVRGAFTGAHTARKGYFELAAGGSLFLDEIGDLPLELQGKLLRVLEEGVITPVGATSPIEVKTRVIAATNANLTEKVSNGRFREDLYFRLNVFPIQMPRLSERRQDIPDLVNDLSITICRKLGRPVNRISPDVIKGLQQYSWPGNVRELRNVLERAFILAGNRPVTASDFPCLLSGSRPECMQCLADECPGDFQEKTDAFKRKIILDALNKSNGVKKDASRLLGLSPRALSHYLKNLEID